MWNYTIIDLINIQIIKEVLHIESIDYITKSIIVRFHMSFQLSIQSIIHSTLPLIQCEMKSIIV